MNFSKILVLIVLALAALSGCTTVLPTLTVPAEIEVSLESRGEKLCFLCEKVEVEVGLR